ncbi:pyridoxamine 5'-phosphate oxidase family protein [Rhizorhabdus histidinilytica]|uniref:pyridoxamine 5'-phosphate oxidase family protein n=1 Tax=Rhizorhabdus histidinilytica TaxID=439228 RepID=UPI00321FECFF
MTGIDIPAEVRALVDGALESDHPLLLAVVNPQGEPLLSYRGSARVHDDGRSIGLWLRNAGGGTIEAICGNPAVALMYRSEAVPFVQFRGHARVVDDPATRDEIFDRSPERERAADPERGGVAILVGIDRIEGVIGFEDGKPRFLKLG